LAAACLLLLTFIAGIVLAVAAPAYGTILWRGDFNSGDLSQWQAVAARPGDAAIVRRPLWEGHFAFRSHVGPRSCPLDTDKNPGGGCKRERAIVRVNSGEVEGTTSWWRWAVRWPRTYRAAYRKFNIFATWHPRCLPRGCQANLQFDLDRNRRHVRRLYPHLTVHGCTIGNNCGHTIRIQPLLRSKWHRFLMRARWSRGADGLVQLWVDGRYRGALRGSNMYSDIPPSQGKDVFPVFGLYRGHASFDASVYIDGVMRMGRLR
jgi:polysaccharide lyase-like protein